MKKILLIQIPPLSTQGPYLGCSLITSYLKEKGHEVVQRDLNITLDHDVPSFSEMLARESFTKNQLDLNMHFVDLYLDEWLSFAPEYVGLSGLSYYCINFANYISRYIKKKYPNIQLVMGGAAVDFDSSTFMKELNAEDFDFVVEGNGFFALDAIVSGTASQKFLKSTPHAGDMPYPDYSDLPLDHYGSRVQAFNERANGVVFYVNNSIGCTQKCSFCSVPKMGEKFSLRNPLDVAKEILLTIERYNVYKFEFTDNLINASTPLLKKLLLELEKVKNIHPEFTWYGLAIVKNQKNSPQEIFDLLAKSGNVLLAFGVESGSRNVLQSMQKKYLPEDLIYNLAEFEKVSIKVTLLFIVGFPTESDEDFQETLSLLRQIVRFKGIIRNIRVNIFVMKTKNDVAENPSKYGVRFLDNGKWESDFVNEEIAESRYREFCDLCDSLNLPLPATLQKKSFGQVSSGH